MGYLERFAEKSDLFKAARVSCEKYGMMLGDLTRLIQAKQNILSRCGACHSEIMLLFAALDYAADNGENITVAQAAKRLDISVPAVSRTLRALSEKGLIKRDFDKKDRRSVRIIVMPAGEKKLQMFIRFACSVLNKAFGDFSDEEIELMSGLQNKFVDLVVKASKGE